jgi:F-box-like domain
MKGNSLLQIDSDNDDEISCNISSALDSSLQQTRAVSSPVQPNHRKHHLLTLPAEIRTKILKHCFIKPKSIPLPPDPIYKHHQKLEGYGLAPQVLCICKQISKKACTFFTLTMSSVSNWFTGLNTHCQSLCPPGAEQSSAHLEVGG